MRTHRNRIAKADFFARDTESPYVDTRANLTTGPETRYYVAQFLQKDVVVREDRKSVV